MLKKENIKVITLDFDGTSLQKDQIWISPRNMHALKECQAKGIEIIPCSGRVADMFPPQIQNDMSFRYWITCCGARVIDRLNNHVIYKDTFSPQQTAEICSIFENKNIYAEISAEGRLFFENSVLEQLHKYSVPSHHVWYFDTGRQIPVYGRLSEFFLNQNIGAEKFNLYGIPTEQQKTITEKINSLKYVEFKNEVATDLQFLKANTEKTKGIEIILNKLGYTYRNVMSIGDTMSLDGLMIERAGFGVTLKNAEDRLKQIADYITDYYYNDGLAKVLEEQIL